MTDATLSNIAATVKAVFQEFASENAGYLAQSNGHDAEIEKLKQDLDDLKTRSDDKIRGQAQMRGGLEKPPEMTDTHGSSLGVAVQQQLPIESDPPTHAHQLDEHAKRLHDLAERQQELSDAIEKESQARGKQAQRLEVVAQEQGELKGKLINLEFLLKKCHEDISWLSKSWQPEDVQTRHPTASQIHQRALEAADDMSSNKRARTEPRSDSFDDGVETSNLVWVNDDGDLETDIVHDPGSWRELLELWRVQRDEWFSRDGNWPSMRLSEEKCVSMCINGRIARQRWTTDEPGRYACRPCANKHHICIGASNDQLVALPLPPQTVTMPGSIKQTYVSDVAGQISRKYKGVWAD